LKNEPEKLLKIKDRSSKTGQNEAKKQAGHHTENKQKPRKRHANEPENEAGHVAENKGLAKNEPEKESVIRPPGNQLNPTPEALQPVADRDGKISPQGLCGQNQAP